MTPSDSHPAQGPLSGLRVIDLATVIAGPGAARYLADFGADVIKVERPGGDATRSMGWIAPGEDDSLLWKLVNRGKRSIVLDLKATQGLADMWALIECADVLVENMRPGKLEALGLSPAALLERNPRLVILRVSGFGQTGPYSQRPGFATIAEAMSGFSDLSGEPDGGPMLPPVALADEVTALVGAFSTMVAVFYATRSGQGQVVDVSLLDSLFQIMGPLPSAWDQLGYLQPRMGSSIPFTVPRGTYQCADGVWVAVSASAESVAGRLLELLGVTDDERFTDFRGRFENREALEAVTRKWIGERSSDEVLASFEAVDAAIGKVNTIEEAMLDPHIIERASFTRVEGVMMQNVAARMSLTPGSIASSGPALGADTETILAEIRKD